MVARMLTRSAIILTLEWQLWPEIQPKDSSCRILRLYIVGAGLLRTNMDISLSENSPLTLGTAHGIIMCLKILHRLPINPDTQPSEVPTPAFSLTIMKFLSLAFISTLVASLSAKAIPTRSSSES
jgi:hypothetical protein